MVQYFAQKKLTLPGNFDKNCSNEKISSITSLKCVLSFSKAGIRKAMSQIKLNNIIVIKDIQPNIVHDVLWLCPKKILFIVI